MIRPLRDLILIRCEPFNEKKGSIIVLAHHQRVRHGRVLAVGPGRYKEGTDVRVSVGVEVGQRVSFFRENMEHQSGKRIQDILIEIGEELGTDLALIRSSDVLMEVGKDTVVDT